MKKLKTVVIAVLLCVFALVVSACSSNALSAPTGLKVDLVGDTISWNEVQNASRYSVEINGKERYSTKNRYSIAGLAAGKYTVRIKAMTSDKQYSDSDWTRKISFTKEPTSGIKYALVGNTEYIAVSIGTARGDVVIEDYYKGLPVTQVADKAFYTTSATTITSLVIGANVKKIGNYAFANCSNLASLTIPETVTQIGEGAFQSCRALTEVTVPDSITQISDYAFKYCRNLKSITLGKNTVSIGKEAFCDCDKLESVTIPDTVVELGNDAFYGCETLASANLGSGITKISKGAFGQCESLSNVSGGGSVLSIGANAFDGCIMLESFNIGSKVESIGNYAFKDCEKLAAIVIPESVTSIGVKCFDGTKVTEDKEEGIIYADKWAIGYADPVDENGNVMPLQRYDFRSDTVGISDEAFVGGSATYLNIPESTKYIGKYAFAYCRQMTSAALGNGLKKLGAYAFYNCEKLGRGGTVQFGNSLESIGNYAFYGCQDLGAYAASRDLDIPDSVTSIGTYAFKKTGLWHENRNADNKIVDNVVYVDNWAVGYIDNDTLSNVTLRANTVGIANYAFYQVGSLGVITVNDSLKYIGTSAFHSCIGLTYVHFGELSVITEIPDYAFYKCSSLISVSIPASVDRIGRSAFYKSSLSFIEIPKWLSYIDDYAFYGCTDLHTVIIEQGSALKSIGSNAFSVCTLLRSISLPDSLESIGDRAFMRCTALKDVNLGGGVKTLGAGVFNQCTALESIALPATVDNVPESAFYKCTALKTVDFGPSIKKIGKNAFYGCSSITRLILPDTVEELSDYAFRKCVGVKSVILGKNLKKLGSHVFNGCSYLTVYVLSEAAGEEWAARWNSGYRPVFFGCTLSEDGGYIASMQKSDDSYMYETAKNGISDCERDGYDFAGWSAEDGTVYTSAQIAEAPDGEYTSLWTVHVDPPEEQETPEEEGGEGQTPVE